ncbi:FMN-binding glutamate synthase family protein [Roseivirga thermotolerans]|uniref:FMN-binding glutamate synthase family protein n=1 Tax=Roseivirga thermotolerans TaxID=1758176 RepID=A0ABQ3I7P0_9BACT|nr:FMN-binding glutamate synthase family protein [Roseivirga thermotolerans]GHE70259.1 FMN-binding glutamate synthase family protein [Roseivirga thermotolerans]
MDQLKELLASTPWWVYILLLLLIVFVRDILQKKHTISHNFPIVGHLRYLLERIGPELRQYIVANNREELPFNRSQRSWIYASSKKQNNYQGFGTDQDQSAAGYVFINPALFPYTPKPDHPNVIHKDLVPCAKLMGGYNQRKRPFRPRSIVNISAMSFGSLSARAIESLNRGAYTAGAFHNTGEGGYSPYHQKGADTVLQIGTGYFGVRDENGNFDLNKLIELTTAHPQIRAIEIKLSQGAKPGKGGVLPASKITREIAEIRHIPMGQDVVSPSNHSAFSTPAQLLDFIELLAAETGLPVGFKAAVGKLELWEELTDLMLEKNIGPDFIAIDGGEGGTGAAPPSFANHVALPFVFAFAAVYKIFQKKGLTNRVVFIASGKLGFPSNALMAFAMGADLINVAREAMMSVGCIQAQSCHTNTCPAGVATQNKWLQSGIDVKDKSARSAQYLKTLRKEILEITHAAGYEHPCQMTMDDVDVGMGDNNYTTTLTQAYKYQKEPVPFSGMNSLIECPHLGAIKTEN